MQDTKRIQSTDAVRYSKYAALLRQDVTITTPTGTFTLPTGSSHAITKLGGKKEPVTVFFLTDQFPEAMTARLSSNEIEIISPSSPNYPQFLKDWHGTD